MDEQNFRDLWFLSSRGYEDHEINISWDDWQSKLTISVLSLCFVRFLHKSQIISLFILSSFFSLHPFFNTPPGASNDCRRRHESRKDSPTPQTPLWDNKSAILRTNVTLWSVYKTVPETGLSYLRARNGPRRLPALLRRKTGIPPHSCSLLHFSSLGTNTSQDSSRLCSEQLRCSDGGKYQETAIGRLINLNAAQRSDSYCCWSNKTKSTSDSSGPWRTFFQGVGGQKRTRNASLTLTRFRRIGQNFVSASPARSAFRLFPLSINIKQRARLINSISFFPACSVRSPRVLWYMSSN